MVTGVVPVPVRFKTQSSTATVMDRYVVYKTQDLFKFQKHFFNSDWVTPKICILIASIASACVKKREQDIQSYRAA